MTSSHRFMTARLLLMFVFALGSHWLGAQENSGAIEGRVFNAATGNP